MTDAPSIVINLPGYTVKGIASFSTLTALRARPSSSNTEGFNAIVDGGDTSGDGGGGVYVWSSSSVATDDGRNIIRPNDRMPGQAGRYLPLTNVEVPPVGLFINAGSLELPEGTNLVQTAGYSVNGVGAARFAYDSTVNAAYVAEHPGFAFMSANGRGFRNVEPELSPFMAGARDATGTIKGASEVVYDCSPVLEAMWAYVLSQPSPPVMDLSGAHGLGITRTLSLDNGNSGPSWWNGKTYRVKPGRLVAMAPMENMVEFRGKNWDCVGRWELWAGTDTQLNNGYRNCFAKNGMWMQGVGNSRFGFVTGQGLRRFLVQPSKLPSRPDINNNISMLFDGIVGVQCGSNDGANDGIIGAYSGGVWEGTNGTTTQRHLMTIALPTGVSASDLEVGDPISFNSYASEGMLMEVVSSTSTTATIRVWPWQPIQAGGTYKSHHGGAFSAWGADIANTTVSYLYALGSATCLQVSSLYAPKIGSMLAESTAICVQQGGGLEQSMEGLRIDHLHFENVTYTVLDYASAARSFWYGTRSSYQQSANGEMGNTKRLSPGFKTGSTFDGYGMLSLRGVAFEVQGGVVYSAFGGNTDKTGQPNQTLINSPAQGFSGPIAGNSAAFGLMADNSMARSVGFKRVDFGPIYGTGTNGAPTGNVVLSVVSAQSPGVTINGGAGPVTLTSTDGAIEGFAIYEPATATTGNWRVGSRRVPM